MSVLTNPQDPAQPAPLAGYEGLTKREHFAIETMKGLFSDCDTYRMALGSSASIPDLAVKYADDLIKALNK